ncbi:GYD domain-containing protein [Aliiruegeria sabulilitoris]|uniref:GYD domain-containing protein n=1 Tax=Aliiruegeria sabulilitoris TaxID=1510458 RepID=UPI00082C1979|nr:GYD domain-containing protein [Aliiruegeria sabulilitoris]NDR57371.1 GYD domain-containing protein [Pseudoruegeria sp. M32A2M]
MPRFIITGNYTQAAAKGMLTNPSDRGTATGALVEAAGGTMEAYYATTGPTDFIIIASVDDVTNLMSALIVAGASGAASNLQTQRAFTSDELLGMQQKAASMAAAYSPPG